MCCRKNNVEREKKLSWAECELQQQDREILREYSKHALKGILQHMTAAAATEERKALKKPDTLPRKKIWKKLWQGQLSSCLPALTLPLSLSLLLQCWLKYAAHLAGAEA